MTNEVSCPYELPKGWVWTRLGEIVRAVEKVSPRTAPDEGFTYVDIASIVSQRIAAPKTYFGREAPSRARQLVKSGDVLFSTVRTYLKHIAIVDERYSGQIASTGFCVIRPWPCIDSKLVFYLVQTDTFLNPLTQIQRGTSYPAVRDSDVLMQPVAVPPLAEQHRIVAKIEELFTRLDAGVETLTKIKTQLKRYRQAILKHAFEGKLTAEWRQAHQHELEPASVLLERIKQERQRTTKGEYKKLPPLDISALTQLPQGWAWARVGEVYAIRGGGTPSTAVSEYWEGDVPWITSADILGLKDIRPRKHVTKQAVENSAASVVPAGSLIVVTRVGLGKIGLTDTAMCFSQDSQGLVAGKTSLSLYPDYSLYCLYEAVQIFRYKHRGTTINGVTKTQLRELPFAVPPLPEQHRIVEEIERRCSVADNIERTVDQGLKQAERLRQSILKKAFEGKLVPQDPNEEPAEILLERIREERASLQAGAKSKKTTRKRTTTQEMRLM